MTGNPESDQTAFGGWLMERHVQIEPGELFHLIRQTDYFVRVQYPET